MGKFDQKGVENAPKHTTDRYCGQIDLYGLFVWPETTVPLNINQIYLVSYFPTITTKHERFARRRVCRVSCAIQIWTVMDNESMERALVRALSLVALEKRRAMRCGMLAATKHCMPAGVGGGDQKWMTNKL